MTKETRSNQAVQVASLKKELGLRQLFSIAFGTIIGVGWITVLGEWLLQAGSVGAAIGFAGGGVVMILIGLTYSEMASMFPVSGGEVAYSYEVYGLRGAFLTGWLLALSYMSVVIFETISVGWVMGNLIPSSQGPVLYTFMGDTVTLGSLVVGIGGSLVITFANYRGAKMAATFQEVLVFSLLIVSAVFMTAGLVGGDAANLEPLFIRDSSGWIWGGIFAVFATAPFWYSGFDTIPQAMGEKSESAPLDKVGRVTVLAIGIAALFYLAVIFATSMVLSRDQLTALDLPTAGAFQIAFNSVFLGRVVLFAGLLGLVSSWNAFFFASSRVFFALGRGHILPAFFGSVHRKNGTPTGAIIFVGFLSILGAFLGKSAILPFVNAGGTCLAVVFVLTCLGVLVLRKKAPDTPRPYRVASPIIPVLGALGSLVMLVLSLYQPYASAQGQLPLEWIFFIIWTVLGLVFWFSAKSLRNEITERQRRVLIVEVDDDLLGE